MNINFPPVDERFIKSAVEDGYYSNATELVRDAVRRLRESSQSKKTRLQAALKEAEEDIRAGRVVPYTAEFMDECEKRAMENIANGIKPNPDICP